MNSRRSFLKTSAKTLGGLTFCGCGLLHAAEAQNQGPKRITPVFINGKRVIITEAEFNENKFIIKKVIPEGKNEMTFKESEKFISK